MKVDAAFEQLRRANPEPDPAALRRQLQETASAVAERSEAMSPRTPTIERQPQTKPPRRWFPALVAGVLVLLLGIPFLIFRNQSPDVASSPTTLPATGPIEPGTYQVGPGPWTAVGYSLTMPGTWLLAALHNC
ncbi:MAG TPA: hypothetical protein VFV13_02295 [Acidimicrobiia bacterium]|nr:hypothetical protein [Acidimicrobiia bacterium]